MKLNKDLYEKVVHNEKVYNKEIGYKIDFYKHLKMAVYCLVFITKILKSKNSNKRKEITEKNDSKIGISWNDLHKNKIKLVNSDLYIFNIDNKQLVKKIYNAEHRGVNLFKALSFAFRYNSEINKFSYQSFFYRIYLYLLYDFLFSIIRNRTEIYISGHFDRFVSIIADICNTNKISLTIIQHGCIQIFDKPLLKNGVISKIYYAYDFSLPFFSSFIRETNNIDFVKLEDIKPNIIYRHKSNIEIIVFGCQDANPENNVEIINYLLKKFEDKLIYIIPHPRESINYYSKYIKKPNVCVSRKKPINIELFISRYSTLGIEYSSLGARAIFINIDKVKMDFMLSGVFEVYNSLNDFKNKFN